MPGILSVSVMGILWKWLFDNQSGLVNVILQLWGQPTIPFLTADGWAWVPVTLGTVWWTIGFNMTLYLAAMGNIPISLYEAAELDGANGWQKFRFITVPLLQTTTLFVIVTTVLASLQLFGQTQVITGGGPTHATQSVIEYITEEAFGNNQFSSATAIKFCLRRDHADFHRHSVSDDGPRRRRPEVTTPPTTTTSALTSLPPTSRPRRRPRDLPRFVTLCVLALLFLAPLYWMVSTSFKPESDTIASPVQWIPARPTLDNYREILTSPDGNILRWAWNSVFTSLAYTAAHLIVSVLAAYAFARLKFPGRDAWFWTVLSSMMVPGAT